MAYSLRLYQFVAPTYRAFLMRHQEFPLCKDDEIFLLRHSKLIYTYVLNDWAVLRRPMCL